MIGSSLRGDILQANIDMLREMKIEPIALENGYVPVDIDVTPFDNSKTKKREAALPDRNTGFSARDNWAVLPVDR